jgi:hypothetical protein
MSSALQGAVESGAPVSRLHERQSYDPADFGVPTGREEEWRFTPVRRLLPWRRSKEARAPALELGMPAADLPSPAQDGVGSGVGLGQYPVHEEVEGLLLAAHAPVDRAGDHDIAGALVMAAARTTRITHLRRIMGRSRCQPHAG